MNLPSIKGAGSTTLHLNLAKTSYSSDIYGLRAHPDFTVMSGLLSTTIISVIVFGHRFGCKHSKWTFFPLVQPARYPPGFLGEFTVHKKGLARLPHAPAELKSALRFNFLGILSASRIYSDAGGVVHSYRGILYIVRRSWTCSNRRNPFSRFAHQPSWIPMTTRTRPRCGLQSSWLFGRFCRVAASGRSRKET